MGPMMFPVLILCVGIVYSENVTVTTVTSAGDSSSRVVFEDKAQNSTVEYNSNHGQNTSYVVTSSSGQTTEKPLIISTSKEARVIQTLNDSIANPSAVHKTNAQHPNEINHLGLSHKNDNPNHFLPTARPEPSQKFANLTKYATHLKKPKMTKEQFQNANHKTPETTQKFANLTKYATHLHKPDTTKEPFHNSKANTPPTPQKFANLTKYATHLKKPNTTKEPFHSSNASTIRNQRHHIPLARHTAPRHVQFQKPHFNDIRSFEKESSHASEIEMEKIELKEMRYVESPREGKKFRYYVAADNEERKPSMSNQMFEMKFPGKTEQRTPFSGSTHGQHNVRQGNHNPTPTNQNSYPTTQPLQYMTPPSPTIYTVRPRITNVNSISITTASPKKFNTSNQLAAKVQPHSGPRDFSCLRCFGNGKPPKHYKYPSYPADENRAVTLLGPDGDNFLGGSKHHYVVAKPEANKNVTNAATQKRPEQQTVRKRPDRTGTSMPMPTNRPTSRTKPHNHHTKRPKAMEGLGSYASPNFQRPVMPSEKPVQGQQNRTNQNVNPQKTRTPFLMDGLNHASSNIEISVSKLNMPTKSPFKLDPSSDLYNLDDELQASASNHSHANVKVETKEIHIPVPEIIETRVPWPIHIKVDRPRPVHIDKPYPVHVEKKVPVPVTINIPQPYPVEKEVPYPVKIPIEVPRPVEVAKPVPYLVENPVPVQVFKHVKVPVKVPVDVPVPYKVHIQVEKRVPYFVEKKVPFEVPVAVEKPYLVEVKKPFEVPQEKPQAVHIEKKIPVPMQVVEFVEVPIPVHPPIGMWTGYSHHEHGQGQHSYQHRSAEVGDNDNSQNTQNPRNGNPSEPSPNRKSKVQAVLPHMISVEFPTGFGHQPTGPSSGYLPAAGAQETK